MPVFVDTLNDLKTTKRFHERYGSYPVLRIHDHDSQDLAGRIDGNPLRGEIPIEDLLAQLQKGLTEFRNR